MENLPLFTGFLSISSGERRISEPSNSIEAGAQETWQKDFEPETFSTVRATSVKLEENF